MKKLMLGRLEGFTLIELLVVVLIIGILASVALPQYQTAVEKSRAAEAWSMLKSIDTAQRARNLAAGTQDQGYPFDELDISFTDANGNQATGTVFSTQNFKYYIEQNRAVAESLKTSPYYTLTYYKGKRYCFETSQNTWCKRFGFNQAGGANCISWNGAGITSDCWTEGGSAVSRG